MEIVCLDGGKEIAAAVAERICSLVNKKPNAVLGLATGSSPLLTYAAVAERAAKEGIDFSRTVTFNLDEYVDCPDESQSYRRFMDVNLFSHINIDVNNTHFPDPTAPDRYDGDIVRAGGIDIQLLGIGGNGHIGFNEPGTPFDSKTHIVTLAAQTRHDNARFFASPDLVPEKAVTAGLETIMRAREIILIATGAGKADALSRMRRAADISCPASVLLGHPAVTVYCDRAACGGSGE